MTTNPFTYGNPIDPARFSGRQYRAGEVINRLHEGGCSSILGEWRVGKTSFLKYVSDPNTICRFGYNPDEFRFVFISLQRGDCRNPTDFWNIVLDEIGARKEDDQIHQIIADLKVEPSFGTRKLKNLLTTIGKRQKVVLLLDEFDNVVGKPDFVPEFFDDLRCLAVDKALVLVTSSRNKLKELLRSKMSTPSPFHNIFAITELGLLTPDEAGELIDKALAGTPSVHFDRADREYLQQMTGFHPFFLQMAAYFLFEGCARDLSGEERFNRTRQRFKEEAASHFSDYWHLSNPDERITLIVLALLHRKAQGRGKFAIEELRDVAARSEGILGRLVQRSLLCEVAGRYALFSPLFGEWIVAEVFDFLGRPDRAFETWLRSIRGDEETAKALEQMSKNEANTLSKVKPEYRDLFRKWLQDEGFSSAIRLLVIAIRTAKNPYIAVQPVEAREMFFGRQDVFEFIRRNLIGQYQDNAIVLYGEPWVGKTSILEQMHHHLGQSHMCVYLDLESIAFDGVGNLLWQVADAIWRMLQAEGIELQQPTLHEFTGEQEPRHYFAEVFLKQVKEVLKDCRLLLMFDEATRLWDGVRVGKLESDIFPYLSHLLQSHPMVNFLFCIGNHPRKVDLGFAQAFRAALYMEISLLEREAALDLVIRPVKGLFEYSQPATEEIYRLTSGHPYFIQLICHSLFNYWQELQRDRLDKRDVEAVLDKAIEAASHQLQDMWMRLTTEERAILATLTELISEERGTTRSALERTLAAHSIYLAPGQVTAALESLSDTHVISPYEPYFFQVDLFRVWIRKHTKIERVTEEIHQRVRVAEKRVLEHPEQVRRRYLHYVQGSCKWLDFRGLMALPELFFLCLSDVYVPLRVTVARSEELFKDLALRARARYLAEELAKQEISPAMRREMADKMYRLAGTVERQRVDAVEMLKEHPRLVILGDPGSGKTTFLRYLALTFAEGRKALNQRLGLDADLLPILIPIDAYAAALRVEPELSLTDYLPRYFASRELDLPELSAYFRQELAAGRCLMLLDGLDTVIDSAERLQVARRAEVFISHYAGNRFVVTSRIKGYQEAPLVGDYLHCTASDLEMPEVERFAHQWSLACEIQVAETSEGRARAEVQASRLIEAIKAAPGVRRLTGNPLLLTMVALVHRQGRLPRHRIALYAECARTLIERWNQVRSIAMRPVGLPMDATEAYRNFAPLALWMHEEKRRGTVSGEELEWKLRELLVGRGLPEEDASKVAHIFLEMERNQTGLLVERGVNAYGFSHLTFQEYFAARAIAVEESSSILERLRVHLHDPRWREIILLTAGQIGIRETREKAVTALVQAIASSRSPLENVLHRDLLLAGRCLADDVGVSYRQREELLNRLLGLWHTTSFDWLRRETTDILTAMRGTACEPQVVQALLADLDAEDAERCEVAADALGRMGMTSDSVLNALTEALRTDTRPRVRAHAALALSRLNVAPERVARALDDALRHDAEREVRLRAAETLAYIGQENDQAIGLLLSALEDMDGNIRGSAAAALTSLRKPQEYLVNALLKALHDSRVDVRANAANILGRLGQRSARVIEGLVKVLQDPRGENARISAAMALGQVGDTSEQVVQALIKCLADDSRVVRKNAAVALGKLGAKADNVVTALEKALQDERTGVGAADALGQAGQADLSTAGVTERQLQAAEWQDRIRAVEALVGLDKEGQASQKAIETLADVLREEHRIGWDVLVGTAITLSEVAKRSDAALGMVVNLLSNDKWMVRTAAAEALGLADKETPEVIEALIQTLQQDTDDHARGNAAAALGALGVSDDTVVDMLVEKLSDPQGYVRVAAADALSKLGVRGKKKVLDGLYRLLDDGYYSHYQDKTVRDAAFDALWVLAPYSATELVQ